MINITALKEETDRMAANWAEYENTLYAEYMKIKNTDLSLYQEDYQATKRQELWDAGAKERNQIFSNFENHCLKIEGKLKDSFENKGLLELRKRFAEEHGITLTEADNEIKRYVNNPEISIDAILDKDHPYQPIFADELSRSKRAPKDRAYLFDQTGATKKRIQGTTAHIKSRISDMRAATLELYPYRSGEAVVNMLAIQRQEANSAK